MGWVRAFLGPSALVGRRRVAWVAFRVLLGHRDALRSIGVDPRRLRSLPDDWERAARDLVRSGG